MNDQPASQTINKVPIFKKKIGTLFSWKMEKRRMLGYQAIASLLMF